MEILGVTLHHAKGADSFWVQLRNRPKYWWQIIYTTGNGPWRLRCGWGWTFHYGEDKWKSSRIIWIGPVELSRDEK